MSRLIRILIIAVLIHAAVYLLFAVDAWKIFYDPISSIPFGDISDVEVRRARTIQYAACAICVAAIFCLRPWPSRLRRIAGVVLLCVGAVPHYRWVSDSMASTVVSLALGNIVGFMLIPLTGAAFLVRWPKEPRPAKPHVEAFD